MSDALLERQANRQRQPTLTAAKRSASAKLRSAEQKKAAAAAAAAGPSPTYHNSAEEDGTFDAAVVANPVSKASVIVDADIARKVQRARAALDKKANIDAHIERHARSQMPKEYEREMKRAAAVAQRVFNKGSIRETKMSNSKKKGGGKLRVPADQRKAATLRKTRKNNRRQSTGADPRTAGKKSSKKKSRGGRK